MHIFIFLCMYMCISVFRLLSGPNSHILMHLHSSYVVRIFFIFISTKLWWFTNIAAHKSYLLHKALSLFVDIWLPNQSHNWWLIGLLNFNVIFLWRMWCTSSSNFLYCNFQAGLISAYIIKTLYFGRYNQMHLFLSRSCLFNVSFVAVSLLSLFRFLYA